VKIQIETGGARQSGPNYGILREGLRINQQSNPTAVANGKARALREHAAALVRTFAGPDAAEREAARGSFRPDLPPLHDPDAE